MPFDEAVKSSGWSIVLGVKETSGAFLVGPLASSLILGKNCTDPDLSMGNILSFLHKCFKIYNVHSVKYIVVIASLEVHLPEASIEKKRRAS